MGTKKKADNDSGGGDELEISRDDTLEDIEGKGASSIVEMDGEFKSSLHKWFALNNREQLTPSIYVYRMTGFNSRVRSNCDFFTDHIPDEHEIGMKHGSGIYEIYVQIPRGQNQAPKASMRRISIDPHYDDLRRDASIKSGIAMTAPSSTLPAAAAAPSNSMAEMFGLFQTMLQTLVQMISPLINAGGRPNSAGAEMIQSYTAMNALMKQMSMENMGLLTEMQRKALSLPSPADDEPIDEQTREEGGTGFMDTLVKLFSSPAVMALLNALTGAGQKAKIAAQTVQAIPDVKKILVDPVKLKETVNFMDKSLGVDKTSVILRNLSVRRPEGTGRNIINPSFKTRFPAQNPGTRNAKKSMVGKGASAAGGIVDKAMNAGGSK